MPNESLVKRVIAELFDIDEDGLRADMTFDEIEGWDSVNALRVLVYLERELNRPIDYDRFQAAVRLGDLWQGGPATAAA
jgi:acyl carrier protein